MDVKTGWGGAEHSLKEAGFALSAFYGVHLTLEPYRAGSIAVAMSQVRNPRHRDV